MNDNTNDTIASKANELYALYANGADQLTIDVFFSALTKEQMALIGLYMRNKRLEIEREMAQATAPLSAGQKEVERRFLVEMNATGETSVSGANWRATKSMKTNATMPDPGAFYAFLQQTGRYDMLQRRLAVSVVNDYFEETKQLPPGVDLTQEAAVTLYKK